MQRVVIPHTQTGVTLWLTQDHTLRLSLSLTLRQDQSYGFFPDAVETSYVSRATPGLAHVTA